MERSRLKRANGNWVVGDQFWGRKAELELFIQSLREEAHLLLTAPRRMGKTSLMKEAARRLEHEYLCLYVDLQKSHSAADAIVALSLATHPHASLWEKSQVLFSNVLKKATDLVDSLQYDDITVTLRSGLTEGNWREKGDHLFAVLAAAEKPVVVFFDEIAILANRLLKGDDYRITPERRRQTDEFMSWLRQNSIIHKGKVRLVLTGSIGLAPILRQAGLSATLNTFSPFSLGPWSHEAARGCVEALANEYGLKFAPQAVEGLVGELGCCIPHHVQLYFDTIYQACRLRDTQDVSVELVQEVYRRDMIGLRGHAALSHLEERLKMMLSQEDYVLALDLLTEAACTGALTARAMQLLGQQHRQEEDPRSSAEVQREIIEVLEHDGYLSREGEEYRFVSKLLRDWWKAHFGFGYVPAAERQGVRP